MIWLFPGSVGVYFWIREFRPASTATVAAVLYAAMPYHLLQVYRFQLYSEFVAAAILPFCFLFVTRFAKRATLANILGLSVSCSLIVLTHIPSTIIGFACLGLYAGVILDWRHPLRWLGKSAAVLLICVACTGFYLIRLVTEVSWVKHSAAEFSSGFFDYRHHLFPIITNFGRGYSDYSMWLFDVSIVMTILILIPLPAAIVQARTAFSWSKMECRGLIAVCLTGAFALFMLSSPSAPIWASIPILPKIQFPWRFQSVAMLMAAVALPLAVTMVSKSARAVGRIFAYSAIVLTFSVVVFDITQVILMGEPLNREQFVEKVVDQRGAEGCSCWWPTWVRKEAFESTVQVFADGREIDVSIWHSEQRQFDVSEGTETHLRVATFYYPYWKAKVNDRPTVVSPDENGAILIPIKAEAARVNLIFEEPVLNRILWYVSVCAWMIILLAITLNFFIRRGGQPG